MARTARQNVEQDLVREALMRELREKLTFREYTSMVNPKFEWYWHCELLEDVLEQIILGYLKRVMIFEPPRHGKSEEVSRIFPGYFLIKHPDKWVGMTSYSANLAYGFSRNARANYASLLGADVVLRPDAKAVGAWETRWGGGLWAAGVGGPITGKGFDIGIVDDPIKNAEEAASEVIREKHKEWWKSTFYTRAEPGAAIILIMTRWDEDDLAGWLLEREKEGIEDDDENKLQNWHIVHLQAIKTRTFVGYPETCTVEDDDRKIGEALCPERYPKKALLKKKGSVGLYFWEGMYQGVPRSEIGEGRTYYNFGDKNISDEVADQGGTIYVGMDFNVDPMTACIGQIVQNEIQIFDEAMIKENGNTENMCRLIEEMYPDRHISVRPDPTGKKRGTNTNIGVTDHSIIAKHFDLVILSHSPAVIDRVNSVNVLCGEIDPKTGKLINPIRLWIHPRCKNLINALMRQTNIPGTREPQKGKGYDHWTDGLGYFVYTEFPVSVSGGGTYNRLTGKAIS